MKKKKRIILILLCFILFILVGVSFCLKALVNDVNSKYYGFKSQYS